MKLLSYDTLQRENNWLLRVSILESRTILVVMFNQKSHETLVRVFVDELDANLFIEYVCGKHLLEGDLNDQ